jgi:hypothetical protein
MTNRKEKNQGMNWITQKKRLAIYLRDGLCCSYCGDTVETGAKLTLDHLKPYSKGGDNKETNLVTCCARCNSSRGNRSVRAFTRAVAAYLNIDGGHAEMIEKTVRNNAKRSIKGYLTEAAAMIARRGSVANVINGD